MATTGIEKRDSSNSPVGTIDDSNNALFISNAVIIKSFVAGISLKVLNKTFDDINCAGYVRDSFTKRVISPCFIYYVSRVPYRSLTCRQYFAILVLEHHP